MVNSDDAVSESACTALSYPMGNESKDWFHGELTRRKAEQALTASDFDCFLIRQSQGSGDFVLSLTQQGKLAHIKIKYGPSGYELQGAPQLRFFGLQELVNCYSRCTDTYTIDGDKFKLGIACKKTSIHAGMLL